MYQIALSPLFAKKLTAVKQIDRFIKDVTALINNDPFVGHETQDSNLLTVDISYLGTTYRLSYSLDNWDHNIITLVDLEAL